MEKAHFLCASQGVSSEWIPSGAAPLCSSGFQYCSMAQQWRRRMSCASQNATNSCLVDCLGMSCPSTYQPRLCPKQFPFLPITEKVLQRKTLLTWWDERWGATVGANTDHLFLLHGNWLCGVFLGLIYQLIRQLSGDIEGLSIIPCSFGFLHWSSKYKCNTPSDSAYWTATMDMLIEKVQFSKYGNTYVDTKNYIRSISLSCFPHVARRWKWNCSIHLATALLTQFDRSQFIAIISYGVCASVMHWQRYNDIV